MMDLGACLDAYELSKSGQTLEQRGRLTDESLSRLAWDPLIQRPSRGRYRPWSFASVWITR